MINFKSIGQRVKNARREKGFTQESFSELLGISTEHLSRIETGAYRPSLQLIEKICSALELTEEELMFGNQTDIKTITELTNKIACLSPEKQKAVSLIIDLIT
jgi:transcriptional regulator with XRE-family HTH domain